MAQFTPQDFKTRILSKYPDGVSSDGTPYIQMNAEDLVRRVVASYPDGMTNDGIAYKDFLPAPAKSPTQPNEKGALFNVKDQDLKSPKKVAAKTVGNVVPDFLRTLVTFPYDVGKQVLKIPQEIKGLKQDSATQDLLTPEAKARAKAKGLPTADNSGGGTKALGTYLSVLTDPSMQEQYQILKGILPSAAGKVLEGNFNGAAQDIANHPFQQIAPFLVGFQEAVTKGGGPDLVAKTAKPVVETVKGFNDLVSSKIAQSKDIKAQKAAVAQTAARDAAQQGIYDAYQEQGGRLAKSNKILQKAAMRDKDPAQILAERGIVPEVTKDGLMKTADKATELHESARPYNEALDRALDTTAPAMPGVPLDELAAAAKNRLRSAGNINDNSANVKIAELEREIADYKANFGDTVNLKQLNGIKQGKWSTTNFDLLKPHKPEVDYAIGRAAKDIIAERTKGQLPINELNDYIGSIYEAEKFLRSLDGKTVKGGRLGKYTARATGSIIGSSMGGPFGGLAGMYAGDLVQQFLMQSTFSNPLKSYLLEDLRATDPTAYFQILDYLRQAKMEQEARPQLPAPSFVAGPEYKGAGANFADKALPQHLAEARLKELGVNLDTKKTPISVEPVSDTKFRVRITQPEITAKTRIPELRIEIDAMQTFLENNPLKRLTKFESKAKPGTLPEVTGGQGGLFNKTGDDIGSEVANELGHPEWDSNDVAAAYEDYAKARKVLKDLKAELRTEKGKTFGKSVNEVNKLLQTVSEAAVGVFEITQD